MNEAFLFDPTTIDRTWLEAFAAGLKATPEWIEQGVTAVERRYAADPAARDGYSRIAFGLVKVGEIARALGLFERDWAADRMLRWQFLRYLDALVATDQFPKAEACVAEYYVRHPEARDGWAVLAHHLGTHGAWDRAAELFARDQAAGRMSPAFLAEAAIAAVRCGRTTEAEGLMRASAEKGGLRPGQQAAFAEVLHQQRLWPAAAKWFQREDAIAGGGITPTQLPWWAECAARAGDWEKADALVRRAIETRGARRDDHVRLAQARAAAGNWPAADELLERDRDAGGLSAGALLTWGRVKSELAQYDAAEALVGEAYAADGSVRDGFTMVADALFRAGEHRRALDLFRRDAAQQRLGWAGAWRFANRLAERVALEADGAACMAEMRNLTELTYRGAPTSFTDGYGRLAQRLWFAGFVEEAIDFMAGDERHQRQTPEFRFIHAEYALKLGRAAEATRLSNLAVAERPQLQPAWKRLIAENHAAELPALDVLIGDMLRDSRAPRQTWASYLRSNARRVSRDVANVRKFAAKDDHVVDVGCSPPLLLALLHGAGFRRLSGIDPFLGSFAPFLSRTGISAHAAGLKDLPVPELREKADVVCLCEVVEHVALNLIPVLTGIRDMLRVDGRLYLTTPNLRSISGLYALLRRHSGLASKPEQTVRAQFDRATSSSGYFGHLREYTAKEIIDLVESCGFTHVVSHFDPVSVHHTRGVPRTVRWLEACCTRWRLFGAHVFRRV